MDLACIFNKTSSRAWCLNLELTKFTEEQFQHLHYIQQSLTSSWKFWPRSLQPGSILTKSTTSSTVQLATLLALCWSMPGKSLQCCSQHSGRSLAGEGNMADMKTLWWMPWCKLLPFSAAEKRKDPHHHQLSSALLPLHDMHSCCCLHSRCSTTAQLCIVNSPLAASNSFCFCTNARILFL